MSKLLPIGSIVMVDVEKKEKIMIIGRLVKHNEEEKVVWDYCGCLAPFGLQTSDGIRMFNHTDIKRLLFIGYQDEEELQYSLAATLEQEKHIKKTVDNDI